MGDGRLAAVADTGPLIHLAEIGCLPLLAIFDEFHVPEGVWQEAQRPASIHSELGRAERHTLPRAEVEEFAAKKGLQKLHGAERESCCCVRSSGWRCSSPTISPCAKPRRLLG